MGPGRYTMGNPTVMVNALPAVNLLCPTTGNDFINPIGAVMVPSITNVFFSRAGNHLLELIQVGNQVIGVREGSPEAVQVVVNQKARRTQRV